MEAAPKTSASHEPGLRSRSTPAASEVQSKEVRAGNPGLGVRGRPDLLWFIMPGQLSELLG